MHVRAPYLLVVTLSSTELGSSIRGGLTLESYRGIRRVRLIRSRIDIIDCTVLARRRRSAPLHVDRILASGGSEGKIA